MIFGALGPTLAAWFLAAVLKGQPLGEGRRVHVHPLFLQLIDAEDVLPLAEPVMGRGQEFRDVLESVLLGGG